jgi:hypothetical protein
MANHPNRTVPTPEGNPTFIVEAAGRLTVAAAQLVKAQEGSPEFEKARKQAFRTARLAVKSLQMMGPESAES